MSRVPIREAIQRLVEEGLVQKLPHRGAVVFVSCVLAAAARGEAADPGLTAGAAQLRYRSGELTADGPVRDSALRASR